MSYFSTIAVFAVGLAIAGVGRRWTGPGIDSSGGIYRHSHIWRTD